MTSSGLVIAGRWRAGSGAASGGWPPAGCIGPARPGSSEELDVRIGGTYALERVANDSSRDPPGLGERAAEQEFNPGVGATAPPVRGGLPRLSCGWGRCLIPATLGLVMLSGPSPSRQSRSGRARHLDPWAWPAPR
jgi:hypothetical protein